MRRMVFTSDNGEHTGEIGLDNEGNLYLVGAAGKSIRLLQDSNEGDYAPTIDNFYNISSLELQNAGYSVLGKQVIVLLAFIKDVPDGDDQSEFDITLPFPPVTDAGTKAMIMFGATSATLDLATGKVRILAVSNPFVSGPNQYQLGFCYWMKN